MVNQWGDLPEFCCCAPYLAASGYQILSRSITEQSGAKALGLAHAVATRTDVITALQTGHSSPQLLAAIEGIRLASKADFIVVGDTHKYRIVHPDSDKIGKKMEGGDSQAALEGESYISEAQGQFRFALFAVKCQCLTSKGPNYRLGFPWAF